jgi:hypothetical protein
MRTGADVVRHVGTGHRLDDVPQPRAVLEAPADPLPQGGRLRPRRQQRGLHLGLVEHPLAVVGSESAGVRRGAWTGVDGARGSSGRRRALNRVPARMCS